MFIIFVAVILWISMPTRTIFTSLHYVSICFIKSISFHVVFMFFHIKVISLHCIYMSWCCIHVPSCSPTATSVISKPIWCCVIDIMPYQKRQIGKASPMRNSMLLHCGRRVVRAKQLLAWQKVLGVRTLSSVIDVVKLALVGGVVGGMHGRRRCPPRTL